MNLFSLMWMGLRRKWIRTVLTVLSIVVAFTLFGVLHGIGAIFGSVLDNAHLDRLYVTNRAGLIRTLPLAHVTQIEKDPRIGATAYVSVVTGSYQNSKNMVVAYAVDPERFFAVYRESTLEKSALERMTQTRTGTLVGARVAERFGWAPGDRIPLQTADGSLSLDVVGIYDTPDDPSQANVLVFDYRYLDATRAAVGSPKQGRIDLLVVRVAQSSQAGQVAADIDNLFSNSSAETRTQNEKEWAQAQVRQIGDITFLINAILGAVFFALLLLTATSMLHATRERIPELAVLKTIGFPDVSVATVVLGEALMVCAGGCLVGLAVAWSLFPSLQSFALGFSQLPGEVWHRGLAIAVFLTLASAVAPTWSALRLSIVDALQRR